MNLLLEKHASGITHILMHMFTGKIIIISNTSSRGGGGLVVVVDWCWWWWLWLFGSGS
jgi:hypothetical protein